MIGRITGKGKLEGGDVLWVDERTLAVGQGFRTNAEGLRQLRELLGDSVDEIFPVQLPYWTGPQDCLHLLSFISIVDKDLAVVYSRSDACSISRMAGGARISIRRSPR